MAETEDRYVPLNNLDLLDEAGTLNPYASDEFHFDTSSEERTLDEEYAHANEEELLDLRKGAFYEGAYKLRITLPSYKTPQVLQQEGQLNARSLAENAIRYIAWYVHRHHHDESSQLSLVDRIQNGNLHMLEAAQKYDPTRDSSLISMIEPHLSERIKRSERAGTHINSRYPIAQGEIIRIQDANSVYYKVREFCEGKSRQLGIELDDTDILALSGFTADDIKIYRTKHIEHVSFHRILGEDGEPIEEPESGDWIDRDPRVNPYQALTLTAVPLALNWLSENERLALVGRLEDWSVEETAVELGLRSTQHASQLVSRALKKLAAIPQIERVLARA